MKISKQKAIITEGYWKFLQRNWGEQDIHYPPPPLKKRKSIHQIIYNNRFFRTNFKLDLTVSMKSLLTETSTLQNLIQSSLCY